MQRYNDDVTDQFGNAIEDATITVRIAATPAASGAIASLFSDNLGTVVLANPMTTDKSGMYGFYAADGDYDVTVSGISGIAAKTITIHLEDYTRTLTSLLASILANFGASLVGIYDSAANYVSTTVEGALAEIWTRLASTTSTLGAALVGYKRPFSGAVATTQYVVNQNQIINAVSDLACDNTGVSDNTTVVNAAAVTLSASGGGSIYFPPGNYKGNFILQTGVYFWGAVQGFGYLAGGSPVNQTKFTAAVTGAVIDTPVTAISNCGVIGINAAGLGSGTAAKGIHFRTVTYGYVRGFHANNFADEGVLFDSTCIACTLTNSLAINCVLNRSRSAKIGAVDIHGTDHYLDGIEATVSGSIEGTVQSASLWCVAFMIRATNCKKIIGLTGEISDIGIEVTGSNNPFVECSAELNYGHGWNVTGGSNRLSACQGYNNSQDTTNTYDNFLASAASANNVYSDCTSINSITKKAKYGFEDLVTSATTKNQYSNCLDSSSVTASYLPQTSNGSSFSWPAGGQKTLTANSTTPDVTGFERFITANSNPTTITNFTGGVVGQHLIVLCNDSNTTIQHNGSTIVLIGGANMKLRSGVTYMFWNTSGQWREITQFPLGVTADVGDAAKTLQYRLNEETQVWATAITVDRAVTLSTTGAIAGARFRIVRKATATGAFNINVGTGPLKAMNTAGSFCDVEYDGSAWFLSAYGTL